MSHLLIGVPIKNRLHELKKNLYVAWTRPRPKPHPKNNCFHHGMESWVIVAAQRLVIKSVRSSFEHGGYTQIGKGRLSLKVECFC